MAYNFTLRDEEDELSAALLNDADMRVGLSSAGRGPAAAHDFEPVQQSATWQPSLPQRDPALQQEWQAAERDMLQRAQYNPREYGGWEVLRDNGGMLIGSLAALASGNTKALPSLAEESNRVNQYYENQRREDAKTAGDFALKARAQKSTDLADQLRIKQIQNEDRRLSQQDARIGLAERGEGRRESQFSRQYDPNNAQLTATKQRLADAGVKPELLEGLDQKGLDDLKHRLNIDIDVATTGERARSEAAISGATSSASSNARNASDTQWAPTLGAARGVGAARAEEIERPGKVKTAADTTSATVGANNEANRGKEETKAIDDFAAKQSGKLKMLKSLDEILAGVPEGGAAAGTAYGDRLRSGIGLGSLNSQAAQDADAAMADIIIKASAEDFGANSTAKQELANAQRILGDRLATPEARTRALRRFRDSVATDLAGASAAHPRAAAAVQGARAGAGGPSAGGGQQMRSPSGNVGFVPPEKVAAARAAGWTVEN